MTLVMAASHDGVPQPLPATAPGVHRYEGVDNFRVAAALGVVFLHVALRVDRGASLSTWFPLRDFTLPFFTMATFFFMTHSLLRNPSALFGPWLQKRFLRLEIPFLVWSFLYTLGVYFLNGIYNGRGLHPFPVSRLLIGYAHLWFLQFLFVTSPGVFLLLRCLSRRRGLASLSALPFVAAGIAWTATLRSSEPWYATLSRSLQLEGQGTFFLSMVADTMGYIPLGIGLALVSDRIRAGYRNPWVRWLAVLVVGAAGWLFLRNPVDPLIRMLYSSTLFVAVLQPWPGSVTRWLRPAVEQSYGIYVLHLFFVHSTVPLLRRAGLVSPVELTLVSSVLVFGLSLATCLWLQRYALGRTLLPSLTPGREARLRGGVPVGTVPVSGSRSQGLTVVRTTSGKRDPEAVRIQQTWE
jgi:hypothetical protein